LPFRFGIAMALEEDIMIAINLNTKLHDRSIMKARRYKQSVKK
jgi:hypothetical protein